MRASVSRYNSQTQQLTSVPLLKVCFTGYDLWISLNEASFSFVRSYFCGEDWQCKLMLILLCHRKLHASQIMTIITKTTFKIWNESHVKMLLVMPLPQKALNPLGFGIFCKLYNVLIIMMLMPSLCSYRLLMMCYNPLSPQAKCY